MKKIIAVLASLVGITAMGAGYTPFGDVHWKFPVASVGALQSTGNVKNDVRTLQSTYDAYIWDGSTWELLASPSAVGSAVTGFSGDVSGSGPGVAISTVNFVGGSSSGAVHAATLEALAATPL